MEEFKISNMYDLNETIAADYMKTNECLEEEYQHLRECQC